MAYQLAKSFAVCTIKWGKGKEKAQSTGEMCLWAGEETRQNPQFLATHLSLWDQAEERTCTCRRRGVMWGGGEVLLSQPFSVPSVL